MTAVPIIDFKEIKSDDFNQKALEVFQYQSYNNPVYHQFIKLLGVDIASIKEIYQIPFLPISFFKDFKIVTAKKDTEKIFSSSGTTGFVPSQHYVADLNLYHQQLQESFAYFYGNFENFVVFPLLPAYAERSGSSLIEMVDFWMRKTGQKHQNYYLYNHEKLFKDLQNALNQHKKLILIGVSFALMDFAERYKIDLNQAIIIETGGMKGRKKEITRQELHHKLSKAFNNKYIQSEYGMTELLSQAYAPKNGYFETPPWMKVLLRDPEDPLSFVKNGKSGGINVIDLANIHSCSFIATDDLGRYHSENQLEILGRFDNSDVRGCNLMVL